MKEAVSRDIDLLTGDPCQSPQTSALSLDQLFDLNKSTLPSTRTPPVRKVRFAGYKRNSTDEQTEDSQPRQTHAIEEYALRTGLQRALDDFVDLGKSGTTVDGREGFHALIRAVTQKVIDVVVVEDLDRFSRNLRDAITYFRYIEHHGAELHSTRCGRLNEDLVAFYAMMAQKGRDAIVGTLLEGRFSSARKGNPISLPYGYRYHPTKRSVVQVVPERAEIVRRISRESAAGVGSVTIAAGLNRDKIPSPTACSYIDSGEPVPENVPLWSGGQIRAILRNTKYVGEVLYGRRKQFKDPETKKVTRLRRHADDVARGHAPNLQIMPLDLWIAGRAGLDQRGFAVIPGRQCQTYLLTPLTECFHCGSRMRIRSNRNNIRYYQCTGTHGATDKGCTQRRLRADWVEREVIEVLEENLIGSPEAAAFRAEYTATRTTTTDYRKEAINKLERDIRDLEGWFKAEMRNAVALKGIPDDLVIAVREEQNARLRALKQQRQALTEPLVVDSSLERLDTLEKGFAHLKARAPFKIVSSEDMALADAVRRFVHKITISDADSDGARAITVVLDLSQRVSPDGDPDPSRLITVVRKIRPDKLFAASAETRAVMVKEETQQAADAGVHDLAEDVWNAIREFTTSEKIATLIGEPKRLLDGMMWYLKVRSASIDRLPARFGKSGAFRKAVRHLVYSGAWDKILETLDSRFPEVLRGCNVQRLSTRRWCAGRRAEPLSMESLRDQRSELDLLLSESTDPHELRRVRSAIAFLDGKASREIANAEGVSINVAYNDVLRFRCGGARSLLKKTASPTRASRGLLSDAHVEELLAIVEHGHSPYRPGRPITRGEIIRVCQERFGVTYSPGGVTDLLQRRGINLKHIADRVLKEKLDSARRQA